MAWNKPYRMLRNFGLDDSEIRFFLEGLEIFKTGEHSKKISMREIADRIGMSLRGCQKVKARLMEKRLLFVRYQFNDSSIYDYSELLNQLKLENVYAESGSGGEQWTGGERCAGGERIGETYTFEYGNYALTHAHTRARAIIESNLDILDSNSRESNLIRLSSSSLRDNEDIAAAKAPHVGKLSFGDFRMQKPANFSVETPHPPPSSAPPPPAPKGKTKGKSGDKPDGVKKPRPLSDKQRKLGEWIGALLHHFKIKETFDPESSDDWRNSIFAKFRRPAKAFADTERKHWQIPEDVRDYIDIPTDPKVILDRMVKWLVENKNWAIPAETMSYSPQGLANRLLEFSEYWQSVIDFKAKNARQFLSSAEQPSIPDSVPDEVEEPVSDQIELKSISKHGDETYKVIFSVFENGRKKNRMIYVSKSEAEQIEKDNQFLMSLI